MFQAAVSGHLCSQAELGQRLGRRSMKRWKSLILQMREPPLLRIPRFYFKGMDEPLSCTFVGFCDASARAYAAVVYMNIVSSEGCVTRFVASKTRVAPLSVQKKSETRTASCSLVGQTPLKCRKCTGTRKTIGGTTVFYKLQDRTLLDKGFR